MRTVYLGDLRPGVKALPVHWLHEHYGPSGEGNRWKLRELAFVDFYKDSDADFFLIVWG